MAAGGTNWNKHDWNNFLDSLTACDDTRNEKRDYGTDTEDLHNKNRRVRYFIERLKLQERVHESIQNDYRQEQKRKIENSLMSSVVEGFNSLPSVSLRTEILNIGSLEDVARSLIGDPTNSLLKYFKEYIKIDSQKPDIKKSGSTWTLDMLAKYFSLDLIEFYVEQPVQQINVWEPQRYTSWEARKEIHDILVTFGVTVGKISPSSTGLCHLNSSKECIVRTILDSLLGSICRQAREKAEIEIQLCPEFSMKREDLPTNIFDYVIMLKLNTVLSPVGIVEAKTPGTMNKKAVAQLVIQLMSLLSTIGDPKSTCFGVLTDGYRFLFAYANGDGIFFESKLSVKGKVTVVVHEADTWEKFDFITTKILNLCQFIKKPFVIAGKPQDEYYTRAIPIDKCITLQAAFQELSI